MTKHIFLTQRSEPVSRWLEAFPDAVVRNYPKTGERLAKEGDGALVWLHVPQSLPEVDAVTSLVRRIGQSASACPVVVMTNRPSQDEGLACLEAGASGYISALSNPNVFRQVALVVENGGIWVGADLMARLRKSMANLYLARSASDRLASLSAREREIALAIATGASNKEVAREKGITERTVKAHLSAVFERLGVRDRLQLSILVNGASKATDGSD